MKGTKGVQAAGISHPAPRISLYNKDSLCIAIMSFKWRDSVYKALRNALFDLALVSVHKPLLTDACAFIIRSELWKICILINKSVT